MPAPNTTTRIFVRSPIYILHAIWMHKTSFSSVVYNWLSKEMTEEENKRLGRHYLSSHQPEPEFLNVWGTQKSIPTARLFRPAESIPWDRLLCWAGICSRVKGWKIDSWNRLGNKYGIEVPMSHVHVKINFSYRLDSWNRCLSVHKRLQIRALKFFWTILGG